MLVLAAEAEQLLYPIQPVRCAFSASLTIFATV